MNQELEKVITRLYDLACLPVDEQERIAVSLQTELDKLTSIVRPNGKREAGLGEGTFDIPEDFDAPLPDAFWLGAE